MSVTRGRRTCRDLLGGHSWGCGVDWGSLGWDGLGNVAVAVADGDGGLLSGGDGVAAVGVGARSWADSGQVGDALGGGRSWGSWSVDRAGSRGWGGRRVGWCLGLLRKLSVVCLCCF